MFPISSITNSATPSTPAPLEPPNANQSANPLLAQCLQAIQAKNVQAAQTGWSELNQNDQTCLIQSLTSTPENITNLHWLKQNIPIAGDTIITINDKQCTLSEWLDNYSEQPAVLHSEPLSHEGILATSPIQACSHPSHPQATPETATGRLRNPPENRGKNSRKWTIKNVGQVFKDLAAQPDPLSEKNIEKGGNYWKNSKIWRVY